MTKDHEAKLAKILKKVAEGKLSQEEVYSQAAGIIADEKEYFKTDQGCAY